MSDKKTVLVTGATGQQGGAVVDALLRRGHHVKGLTRNTDSASAQKLAAKGAEPVAGNFDDPSSVANAAAGVDAVFGMTTMFEVGVEGETRQGKILVDAVKNAGVDHLVFSSVGSADRNTGIPHFDSKYRVEQHIVASGINYSIIGPVFFMENYLSPWYLPGLKEGNLNMPIPPDTSLTHVAVQDIGECAAVLIDRGEAAFGARFDIAGDSKTGPETAAIIGAASGIETTYGSFPAEAMKDQDEDMYLMFDWFNRVGYDVDTDALRREFPEVAWLTLEQWAAKQDW